MIQKTKLQKQASRLLGAAVVLLGFTLPVRAYIVDGLLSDWGVTLFSDWTPDSLTADWAGGLGENNMGGLNNLIELHGYGGERFDVEAAYLDDDPLNVYFAIVTSFPQGGVTTGGIHYRTGDVGLDLWEGGAFGYEYGVKTSGSLFGQVAFGPEWFLPHAAYGWPQNAPSEFSGGVEQGYASLVYRDTGIFDNGYTNYVIEGAISKSLIGGPGHRDVKLHWTMSCGNDAIDLYGDLDNPVPEPATLALFGTGLLGLAFWRKL